jgi:hypothetical protein
LVTSRLIYFVHEIVTFYRHGGKDDPEMVVDTVGETGRQREKKFTSMEEFYRLLGDEGECWKRKKLRKTKNS